MKTILITGKDSYVGNSFEGWLKNYPGKYKVDKISLRDESWKKQEFSSYDVVLHVAGIAHMKETKENQHLYYQVNRDLAYKVAQKAKNDGVNQFIFLSSMSVYGMDTGVITRDTVPRPKTNYGKSKLQAEELINTLNDELFKIAILRPPMIYGKGCKGNYSRLAKLAVKTPVFPKIKNKRSMIFIDNLNEFTRNIIDRNDNGIFFPQNESYVCTSELVNIIAGIHGKQILFSKIFNPVIRRFNSGTINKVFGDLVYEKSMSSVNSNRDYALIKFEESIRKTEDS
ncbi:NAD-dependent epimerase/dehydratase family protein [Oceanobacillus luteolus]|uniref:NAD-dependent epimerase/dehydratase family protein n=1 Tax=Oceanobacillus luteolus TaxID=1274358 RepID=A0ABW4HND9_9BACI